jgi:hypothetical protein
VRAACSRGPLLSVHLTTWCCAWSDNCADGTNRIIKPVVFHETSDNEGPRNSQVFWQQPIIMLWRQGVHVCQSRKLGPASDSKARIIVQVPGAYNSTHVKRLVDLSQPSHIPRR